MSVEATKAVKPQNEDTVKKIESELIICKTEIVNLKKELAALQVKTNQISIERDQYQKICDTLKDATLRFSEAVKVIPEQVLILFFLNTQNVCFLLFFLISLLLWKVVHQKLKKGV